ncbi:uncharacterized protein [Macrobrachium rosenbergii]|uniref:uncharacterized protein n=1 Tax=Macrobrachium rosenbergii TaxID=79674 RepID=UPI0034D6530B
MWNLLIPLAVLATAQGEDCVWNKDEDYPQKPPLIIDASFNIVLPVMEEGKRIVRVPKNSAITLACPGSKIAGLEKEVVQAKCSGGQAIKVGKKRMALKDLSCSKKAKESIRKDAGKCGEEGTGVLEIIGFEIANLDRFYEVIDICYDERLETNLYSKHILHGRSIAAKDVDPKRPPFKAAKGFFNISISKSYSVKEQKRLMEDILESNDLASTVIDYSKQYYFAKGHMAPDADFVTEAEQDATYYYINAVPQWQAFNNGNWKYLEFATRDLASQLGTDLTIYSGSWGTLEMDDVNGNPVEVYLGLSSKEKVVPAPALTWKVIHEEATNRAIGIVGVNNPHLTSIPALLCKDICPDVPWITFDVTDLGHGYTYCCSVSDLRNSIPHIPDLGPVCLLDSKNSSSAGCC